MSTRLTPRGQCRVGGDQLGGAAGTAQTDRPDVEVGAQALEERSVLVAPGHPTSRHGAPVRRRQRGSAGGVRADDGLIGCGDGDEWWSQRHHQERPLPAHRPQRPADGGRVGGGQHLVHPQRRRPAGLPAVVGLEVLRRGQRHDGLRRAGEIGRVGGRRREPLGTDRHVVERGQGRRHDVDEAHRRGQRRVRHLQEPGLAEVQRGLRGPDRGAQAAVGLLATPVAERAVDLLLAGIDQHDVDAAGGAAVETEVEAGWHLVADLPVRCRQRGDRPSSTVTPGARRTACTAIRTVTRCSSAVVQVISPATGSFGLVGGGTGGPVVASRRCSSPGSVPDQVQPVSTSRARARQSATVRTSSMVGLPRVQRADPRVRGSAHPMMAVTHCPDRHRWRARSGGSAWEVPSSRDGSTTRQPPGPPRTAGR